MDMMIVVLLGGESLILACSKPVMISSEGVDDVGESLLLNPFDPCVVVPS